MKALTRIALIALMVALVPLVASASLQVNGNLTVGDGNYLGLSKDGTEASETKEVAHIINLINLLIGFNDNDYSRVGSTLPGPFDEATTTDHAPKANNTNTITLTGIFNYILAKYDGPNWGSEVWYFPDGITGIVTVPQKWPNPNPNSPPPTGYDVSHISAYKANVVVPEPGTIAVWGLLALTGYFGVKKYQAQA